MQDACWSGVCIGKNGRSASATASIRSAIINKGFQMKETGMQRSAFLGVVFLMALGAGCLGAEAVGPEEVGEPAILENQPFYVAVFDHVPTEEELQADLVQYMLKANPEAGISALVNPTDWTLPASGQKLVRIAATTSNITDAGTDNAGSVRFTGIWQAASLQQFSETFVLDNYGIDDLDRNTVSVFYYLLNVGAYTTDRFVQGRISNTSTDGWHCNSISLTESNYVGGARTQSLPFNQWVDYPTLVYSSWIAASDHAWLSYGN